MYFKKIVERLWVVVGGFVSPVKDYQNERCISTSIYNNKYNRQFFFNRLRLVD
jgi:hypothetical protein